MVNPHFQKSDCHFDVSPIFSDPHLILYFINFHYTSLVYSHIINHPHQILNTINTVLVGGISTRLKNMSSSVGMMTFPTEWKVIQFHGSKPPTSYDIFPIYGLFTY